MSQESGENKPVPESINRPTGPRPLLVGSDPPQSPFPIRLNGLVEKGFGRGSKDLGCPTANIPSQLSSTPGLERDGVYYGWAKLKSSDVLGMVMSVGYNPFYGNTSRTLVSDFESLSSDLPHHLHTYLRST